MASRNDIAIRYLVELVDRGTAPLLSQDRKVRRSIAETSSEWAKSGTTATTSASKQVAAAGRIERSTREVGQASTTASREVQKYATAQQEVLAIGSRLIGQTDNVERSYRRRGTAAEAAARREVAAADRAAREVAAAAKRQATAQERAAKQAADAQERAAAKAAAADRRTRGAVGVRARGAVTGALGLGAGYGAYTAARGVVSETVGFDRSLRNVNSIAQLSEKSLGKVNDRLLAMAGPAAQAPRTLADGMYDLVSSGFKADQSLKILHASAMAATAGLSDTATSTKAVSAVLNAYHRPAADAKNVSDVLFQTVNKGVLSFEDLAQNIGDVLPFAASLGVGLDQVGAATATMTKAGISAPETMTRIKSVMEALIKPSENAAAAIKETGYESGESLVKHKGLQGALEAMIATTDGSKTSIAQLFPNIRALGGALALTGKNSKGAHQDLKAFGDAAKGATSKALAEQSKSVSFQWDKLTATAKSLAIEVGEKAVPAMNDVLPTITQFVKQMSTGKGAGGDFVGILKSIWSGARDAERTLEPIVATVANFVADHPEIAKMAGAFAAMGLALKGLRFAGAMTGLSGLLRVLPRVRTQAELTAGAVAASTGQPLPAGIPAPPGARGARVRSAFRNPKLVGTTAFIGGTAAQMAGDAIGGQAGSILSGVGTGAAIGATAGSVLPGIGTAVGAVGGAIVGGVVSFIGSQKDKLQGELIDALDLSGRKINVHLGTVEVSKDTQDKLKDALAKAQVAATRARDGLDEGSNAKRAAQSAAEFRKAADIGTGIIQQRITAGAKYVDAKTVLGAFKAQLDDLDIPKEFRDNAARSMVQYAQGLRSQGRLPNAELKKVVRTLSSSYGELSPFALAHGKRADQALAAGLRAGRARQSAERLINELGKTFTSLPQGVKLNADNADRILGHSLAELRVEIQRSHGQRKTDAETAYAQLVAQQLAYNVREIQAAKDGADATKNQWRQSLHGVQDVNRAIWQGIVADTVAKVGTISDSVQSALDLVASIPPAIHAPRTTTRGPRRRTGGRLRAYATGGLVGALVSPGEELVHGGRSMIVPGARTMRDNVFAMLPHGTAVLTDHGQALRNGGATLDQALAAQMPHFAAGGIAGHGFQTGYQAGVEGARGLGGLLSDLVSGVNVEAHRTKSSRKTVSGGDGFKARNVPAAAVAMLDRARTIAAKGLPYVYGGGHGGFSTTLGGYDCSGYVSNVLGPGVLSAPMAVREPLASALLPGAGKFVTVGIRGTSGQQAHTMMRVGREYFESGGGHGPAKVGGWNGGFSMFHPRGYKGGGRIGQAINRLSGAGTHDNAAARGALTGFAGLIDNVTKVSYGRLGHIIDTVRGMLSELRKGDEDAHQKAQIKRLGTALQAVDTEMGRRTGLLVRHVAQQGERLDRSTTAQSRRMRRQAVSEDSVDGLTRMLRLERTQQHARHGMRADLVRARGRARNAGEHSVARDITDQIRQLDDTRAEVGTVRVEQRRARRIARGQRHVDAAQGAVDFANAGGAALDAFQRLSGTADTPAGIQQRANQAAATAPALQALSKSLLEQSAKLKKAGDTAGALQAFQSAIQTSTDATNAYAEASELAKQATMQRDQEGVDAATSGKSFADIGLQRLELQQKLAGTFDSGGQARADYIKNTIVPAITGEISALEQQRADAANSGDSTLARQIAEEIAGKQNDILQAQVDATEQIAENTEPLKQFGGSLAFSGVGGQLYTDDLLSPATGA